MLISNENSPKLARFKIFLNGKEMSSYFEKQTENFAHIFKYCFINSSSSFRTQLIGHRQTLCLKNPKLSFKLRTLMLLLWKTDVFEILTNRNYLFTFNKMFSLLVIILKVCLQIVRVFNVISFLLCRQF